MLPFRQCLRCESLLIRFSISTGGPEIFSYETEKAQRVTTDQALVTGFMEAIQIFSEAMGTPIQSVCFSGAMLYVHTYGDFSLRLLVEEKLSKREIEGYFKELSKETAALLASVDLRGDRLHFKERFDARLLPILAPLTQEPISNVQIQKQPCEEPISKIALIGLAKAGKTSIRNVFFENWSLEMARETKPTISVEISRKFQEFLETGLLIMDFGGQFVYRNQHLKQKERWKDISALLFVVDLQDPASFEAARDYLTKAWGLISRLHERKPGLSILLHKYDVENRADLSKNVSECLSCFKDYINFANFHLTTIEDASSNIAMIKSLYFSLPTLMIRRLLEEEFLNHFEEVTLPQFAVLGRNEELFQDLKTDIRRSAEILGMTYSVSLQESWLNYLMGDWIPKRRSLSQRALSVTQHNRSIHVRIPHWPEDEIPRELTTILLEGMLEGMLKTFHLEPPEKIEETTAYTTWRLEI